MPKDLQNANLPGHSLDIGLLCDFLFLERFDCYFFRGGYMYSKSDFAKGALAESFACMVVVLLTR